MMASITEVKLKEVIALATTDTDFSHVLAETAKAEAQALANVESKPITLRDPVTDKVLATVRFTK
jgi:hypothetical protein